MCDKHIQDKPADLTEQRIGVNVFGRNEGYNSNDDNIVRNYARTLRKRIEDYFATEGRHEDLRLDIPRGGYVPVFISRPSEKRSQHGEFRILETSSGSVVDGNPRRETSALSISAERTRVEQSQLPMEDSIRGALRRSPPNLYLIGALCIVLIAIASDLGARYLAHKWRIHATEVSAPPSTLSDALWGQVFQSNRDTFVVPADTGLVIMQRLTGNPVALGDYVSGNYRFEATASAGIPSAYVRELGSRRYTSIVDLNVVLRLSRLKEVVPERMLTRYARDLRMDDLRSGNAILLGSVDSNPWAGLFQQQLNFRFSYNSKSDTHPVISNAHPLPGEKPVYVNDYLGSSYNTYATIAYQPNLDGTGHVLLVGGLSMAGTQAAADFLLNPSLMQPVLERAKGPNGTIRPFEILIETGTVASNASRPHVVSERIASGEPPPRINAR
ncbi:MAG TPA: hypothetical protein VGN01_00350 [Acidobacteriaceae bacterium]